MDQSSEEPQSIGQGTITAVQILGRDVNIIVDHTKFLKKG